MRRHQSGVKMMFCVEQVRIDVRLPCLAIKGINSTGIYLSMLNVVPLFHICKDGFVNPFYASHSISCAEAVVILIWLYSMFAVSVLTYANRQLFMDF